MVMVKQNLAMLYGNGYDVLIEVDGNCYVSVILSLYLTSKKITKKQ